jgi:hypothetical protein
MSEPSSLDSLPERQLPDWTLMNIVYVILSGSILPGTARQCQ